MSMSPVKQRIITLLAMDVLLLSELTYAFSRSLNTTEDFSQVFLQSYVPLFVPTIVVFFFLLRRQKRRATAAAESA